MQKQILSKVSQTRRGRFVFTYTVKIANNGTLPAQLLHRYWKLRRRRSNARYMAMGVGEQPTIVPGDDSPTRRAILETAVGTMEGYFEMVAADGEIFKANSMFTSNPGALH